MGSSRSTRMRRRVAVTSMPRTGSWPGRSYVSHHAEIETSFSTLRPGQPTTTV
ncbi:hypothetical protein [Catellatospora paridis]|uniref:hypothetical protein n=1 Tax=Catellatospora paridis TaxID=1617086 RepID=UPI0012D46041|nr:hypothetical protein [Catellatospora paridis]